ncbi:DUF47 domain-containing protein [Clostridium sp. NSJ-49]|jgi:predicted phosphate transport protein (TIGR00153 family)|uniref:Phosphate transport regulator n=1 Tax=Clostridium disporicum TaxID=84024 RepID=A0A174AJP4_9CLOT|nr:MULTISPECIES: DUF47 family protein [Clostridium]MBC5626319.1 DUF47 domain-containing protein [Clostridium sp. NSJ-49]MDU6340927.1 DUF47 family protein [Clostridium sp.]CUN88931.1 phosphate transport regulator [Clostridium disporicum]
MAVKKNNDYFEMLVDLIGYSCEAASLLDNTISNFRMSQIDSRIKDMHKIEHNADIKKHEMINKLSKEFITPIERGDIIELANEIDNVTDAIEDVLVRIYMFNISVMREEAVEFSKLIVKICNETSALIKEFRNFKKSSEIRKLIINISDLEEEGDRIYTRSIRGFYSSIMEPIKFITWKETFEYFEKCCDACEHVADGIESVIMRNT